MNEILNRSKSFLKEHRILNLVVQGILLFLEAFLIFFSISYNTFKNIGLILLGIGITFAYLKYSGYWDSIEQRVLPPNPSVVSSKCDDKSTDFGSFEYSGRVITNVRNLGGSGNVVVEAKMIQGKSSWIKSEMRYMDSQETFESVIVFDEIELMGEDPQCKVNVYAYGK